MAEKLGHLLASFAAGALLATAFFDLIPEAITDSTSNILKWTVGGIVLFFLMERFIYWFHHHHEHQKTEAFAVKPVIPLVIFGDSIHNFIDGLVVGASFVVDARLGVITALAVAAHEIPQEIGDFGIMLSNGMNRGKVLLINFLSSLTTIVGALLVYFTGSTFKPLLPIMLAITAGFFIYIAASDLIPEIHTREEKGFAIYESSLLILGILAVWLAVKLLEG